MLRTPLSSAVSTAVLTLCLAATASAMMPPHVTGVVPADGALTGDTIELHGYSLGYTDTSDLAVTNEATGEPVTFTSDLTCQSEGDPDGPPGSQQSVCVLRIRLSEVVAGQGYAVGFLGEVYTFTAASHAAPEDP